MVRNKFTRRYIRFAFDRKKLGNGIDLTGGGTKLRCKNPKIVAIMLTRKGGTP
jgi:hypothetical protein